MAEHILDVLDWHAKFIQQRRAGVPQIVKANATNTATSAETAEILLTLAGSIGVPIGVVNTRPEKYGAAHWRRFVASVRRLRQSSPVPPRS